VPAKPRAWLVSSGRFKAIDGMRRRARFEALDDLAEPADPATGDAAAWNEESVEDDRLRLIFTCCHPALAPDAQVALTLREICGLTTEEIAHAFLTPAPTVAQRIVRAKAKIRDAHIPYQVPARDELPGRLESVLRVVYLVFNEGYSASSGASLMRQDLSGEAIRLARLLKDLLPEPEVMGLLALMLMSASRRAARRTADGKFVPLAEQDTALWDDGMIGRAERLICEAAAVGVVGRFQLEAAIQSVHAGRKFVGRTDWPAALRLYDGLMQIAPSIGAAVGRAAAMSECGRPEEALRMLEAAAEEDVRGYQPYWATRAHVLKAMGRSEEARAAFVVAAGLSEDAAVRGYLMRCAEGASS
jgi:RNA polymerase sigma-70 factor (ECF subfamily)